MKRSCNTHINILIALFSDYSFFSDKKYLAFLHSCYFDQELAKKTVQYYYKCFLNTPQVFSELNPLADDIKQNYKCM